MTTTHQYVPLNKETTEIRVLHLLEVIDGAGYGHEEQCIRGRFEYTNLTEKDARDKTPYNALSYVWGVPNFTSAIILDDGSQIRVSYSLLVAIQHVFDHKFAPGALPIWIDAVCIDQDNNEEKSWQVGSMGSIYAYATNTLIFLGEARSATETTELETIIPMFNKIGYLATHWGILGDQNDQQTFYMYASVLRWMDDISPKPGMSTHEYMVRQVATDLVRLRDLGAGLLPLDCLLNRPWWSRIWVLQELFMSRRPYFLYGKHSIPATCLLLAFKVFVCIVQDLDFEDTASTSPGQRVEGFSTCVSIDRMPHMSLQAHYLRRRDIGGSKSTAAPTPAVTELSDILDLLQESTSMRATEPRDSVYGILGLITRWSTQSARIHPDYSKSVGKVYCDTASSLLQSGYNDILRMAVSQEARKDLPSWLPDFSARTKYGRSRPHAKKSAFFYALDAEHDVPRLELKGYILGSVEVFDTAILETHERGKYGDWVDHATDEDIEAFFAKVVDAIVQQSANTQESQDGIVAVTLAMQQYMAAVDKFTNQREGRYEAIEALMRRRLREVSGEDTQVESPVDVSRPCVDHDSQDDASVARDGVIDEPCSSSSPKFDLDSPNFSPSSPKLDRDSPSSPKFDQGLPSSPRFDRAYEELQSSDNPTRVAYVDERAVCIRMMGEGSLFLCQGNHWGAASNAISTGDVVARLEIDPEMLYVLKPRETDTYELVSMAAVPSMVDWKQKMEEPMRPVHIV